MAAESKSVKSKQVLVVLKCNYGKNKPKDEVKVSSEVAEYLIKIGFAENK